MKNEHNVNVTASASAPLRIKTNVRAGLWNWYLNLNRSSLYGTAYTSGVRG